MIDIFASFATAIVDIFSTGITKFVEAVAGIFA